MTIIGLDLGHSTTVAAEHWLASLPPVPGLVACTHFGAGRVLITLDGIDPAQLPPATTVATGGPAAEAVRAHAERTGGRAVRYPGVERMIGTRRVDKVLGDSAIERILILGLPERTDPPGDALLDTRSFVRPQWADGRLTLFAMPTPDGHIAPFEVPDPTPCCADH
jgi:hypothetical protein